MKQYKLFILLAVTIFLCNGLQAQRLAKYTVAEQAQLDSIVQTYLNRGIPEKSAIQRAKTVFESKRKIATRSNVRNPSPAPGSIWIDRDASGADFSEYHNYTPEQFVKKLFIKDADKMGSAIDDIIQNVKFYGTGWNHITEEWETTIVDVVNQTSPDDRALHYFDHGDITSTVERCWDNTYDRVPRFGIEKGFLLATGPALRAEGLNEYIIYDNLLSGGNDVPTTGAEELKDIALSTTGYPLHTYTALEFDFIPFVDSISFQYIFTSTEFKENSNSPFNDSFGFFVTGEDLEDAWGNTGTTINIARYPHGAPISVNASNWGYRNSNNMFEQPTFVVNEFIDYDPLGPFPVKTSGFNSPVEIYEFDSTAIHPKYHIPVYSSGLTRRNGVLSYEDCETTLMHYNGYSVVLTAKVKLKKGKKYHMKLAIGNLIDNIIGSGAFLAAGSFDLGAPESDVLRPYATTAYDTIYGWNSLYSNCPASINISFPVVTTIKQDIYIWSEGSGADFVYDTKLNKYFNDSIKYTIPANDSVLNIKFSVDDQVKNGSQVAFYSMLRVGGGRDTTEIFDLYAKSKTELNHFYLPTANYPGKLDIRSANGSPYMQRSLNGGITWEFAYNTTGEMTPFSKTQIANLAEEENAYILYREPNTCCTFDTIFVHDANIPPVILRKINMPVITGAICDKAPGEHFVNSREDFSFTIKPSANNAGMVLMITTSRTSLPDSEGVVIKKNDDGTYTVTIKHIQEPIEIYVDFATSNQAVDNNKVWTNGNNLHIQTTSADEAHIYTVSGSLVCSLNLTDKGTTSVSLPKGFYIVKIDNMSYKVVVK